MNMRVAECFGGTSAIAARTQRRLSIAVAKPAGMNRLNRSQLLIAVQGLYVNAKFDTELSGFSGGDGGNAGGFVPSGSLHYAHRVTDNFRLGVSAGSLAFMFISAKFVFRGYPMAARRCRLSSWRFSYTPSTSPIIIVPHLQWFHNPIR